MMKARWVILIVILILLFGSAMPSVAQGVVNLAIDDLHLDEFPRAEVLVTVRDANGVPIVDLGADRFEIVEDGIASFSPSEVATNVNPDAVISVIMVIDISGSMEGKPIDEAIRAANALLDQLSPQDRAAIIAFADEVKSLDPDVLEEGKELGFTVDKNAVRNVVNFLDTKIGWDTPLYDAIYKGVKMTASEPAGKRAVIVMTDGRDERDNDQGVPIQDAGSLSTPDDPINEANRHNIPIFSVGLVGLGGKIDTRYLNRLAERTGGQYLEAPQPEELTPLFQDVVNQLKTQYILGYDSRLEPDTVNHSLMVRVNLPQGQDFDETKFQILEAEPTVEPTPAELASAAPLEEEQTEAPPVSEEESDPPAQATPEPTSSGIEGVVDKVKDTFEERPALAVVIGAGVLLLIILFVALLIVLLRGRKTEEVEYAPVEFDEPYSPPPEPVWTPGPADADLATPSAGPPKESRTEVAPPSWQEPGVGVPPFAPAPSESAAAGGTRVIERGPKYLAMLVDKSRPDRRHDLKGTMNIGRARDNQIIVDDPTVSRHHAWIKSEGERFLIFDIGSANGTYVNDEKIDAPRPLEHGDLVRFGDAEFVFTRVF
ncbi:MAG: VWA domain-containing protein [Anaerolineae bacterium]